MALVIEDGTGKQNADSYVDIASADAYALRRRIMTWGGLEDDVKEGALVEGFDAIAQVFGRRFKGRRANPAQSAMWPREGVVIEGRELAVNAIPEAIKSAQIELALESLKPGGLWAVRDPNAPVLIERKVGPITRKFAAPATPTQKSFDKVEAILSRYFEDEYMSLTVYRA